MKEKDIDQLFKDSFKSINETPDPKIWENIAKELEKTPVVSINKQKSWQVYFQIAALITVIGSLAMIIWNQQQYDSVDDTPKLITHQQDKIETPSDEIVTTEMTKLNPISAVNTSKMEKLSSNPVLEDQSEMSSTIVDIIETEELVVDTFNHQEESANELAAVETDEYYNVGTHLEEIKVPQIDDIQLPTITTENKENIEPSEATERSTLMTTVLNKITENIDVIENKNIRFSADEEGSLRLQIINSIVKNPFNKRK